MPTIKSVEPIAVTKAPAPYLVRVQPVWTGA